jgi:hypothetical protein
MKCGAQMIDIDEASIKSHRSIDQPYRIRMGAISGRRSAKIASEDLLDQLGMIKE